MWWCIASNGGCVVIGRHLWVLQFAVEIWIITYYHHRYWAAGYAWVTAMLIRSGRALHDTATSVIPGCRTGRLSPALAYRHLVYHICINSCSVDDGCSQTGQDDVDRHQDIVHRPMLPLSSHQLYNLYDLFWHLIFLNLHVAYIRLCSTSLVCIACVFVAFLFHIV